GRPDGVVTSDEVGDPAQALRVQFGDHTVRARSVGRDEDQFDVAVDGEGETARAARIESLGDEIGGNGQRAGKRSLNGTFGVRADVDDDGAAGDRCGQLGGVRALDGEPVEGDRSSSGNRSDGKKRSAHERTTRNVLSVEAAVSLDNTPGCSCNGSRRT